MWKHLPVSPLKTRLCSLTLGTTFLLRRGTNFSFNFLIFGTATIKQGVSTFLIYWLSFLYSLSFFFFTYNQTLHIFEHHNFEFFWATLTWFPPHSHFSSVSPSFFFMILLLSSFFPCCYPSSDIMLNTFQSKTRPLTSQNLGQQFLLLPKNIGQRWIIKVQLYHWL